MLNRFVRSTLGSSILKKVSKEPGEGRCGRFRQLGCFALHAEPSTYDMVIAIAIAIAITIALNLLLDCVTNLTWQFATKYMICEVVKRFKCLRSCDTAQLRESVDSHDSTYS